MGMLEQDFGSWEVFPGTNQLGLGKRPWNLVPSSVEVRGVAS